MHMKAARVRRQAFSQHRRVDLNSNLYDGSVPLLDDVCRWVGRRQPEGCNTRVNVHHERSGGPISAPHNCSDIVNLDRDAVLRLAEAERHRASLRIRCQRLAVRNVHSWIVHAGAPANGISDAVLRMS
eukprot:7251947-Prymnesium_polylepis.3